MYFSIMDCSTSENEIFIPNNDRSPHLFLGEVNEKPARDDLTTRETVLKMPAMDQETDLDDISDEYFSSSSSDNIDDACQNFSRHLCSKKPENVLNLSLMPRKFYDSKLVIDSPEDNNSSSEVTNGPESTVKNLNSENLPRKNIKIPADQQKLKASYCSKKKRSITIDIIKYVMKVIAIGISIVFLFYGIWFIIGFLVKNNTGNSENSSMDIYRLPRIEQKNTDIYPPMSTNEDYPITTTQNNGFYTPETKQTENILWNTEHYSNPDEKSIINENLGYNCGTPSLLDRNCCGQRDFKVCLDEFHKNFDEFNQLSQIMSSDINFHGNTMIDKMRKNKCFTQILKSASNKFFEQFGTTRERACEIVSFLENLDKKNQGTGILEDDIIEEGLVELN